MKTRNFEKDGSWISAIMQYFPDFMFDDANLIRKEFELMRLPK